MRSWMKMVPLFAAGMLLAAGADAVQAQSVAGTYTWDQPVRMRAGADGSMVTEQTAKVRLAITEVRGDSIFGTYTMDPPAGTAATTPAPAPRPLKGTISGNKLVIVMNSPGRININGSQQEVNMTTTFNATIEGDEIKGTIDVYAPELPASPPQRSFTGKRVS